MKRLLTTCFLAIGLAVIGQTDTVTIYFDIDEHRLEANHEALLSKLMTDMKNGDVTLESLQAHTDTTASIAYNSALSKRRLRSVMEGLAITSNDIESVSHGELVAARSQRYSASEFRKVDIVIRHNEVASTSNVAEVIEEAKIEDDVRLSNELEAFLKDTSNNALIQLTVNFYPGKAILLAGEEEELAMLFEFLKGNPNIDAKIRGHVCCGSNLALSQNRAFVVYDYLVQRGISHTRLTHYGYDNSQPFIWPEITEEDKQKNRRVDVVFSK